MSHPQRCIVRPRAEHREQRLHGLPCCAQAEMSRACTQQHARTHQIEKKKKKKRRGCTHTSNAVLGGDPAGLTCRWKEGLGFQAAVEVGRGG